MNYIMLTNEFMIFYHFKKYVWEIKTHRYSATLRIGGKQTISTKCELDYVKVKHTL